MAVCTCFVEWCPAITIEECIVEHEETIDHLTSGCPILAKNEYLMRHDKVCTLLHYSIYKALGTETADKWYTHTPSPVYEEGDVTERVHDQTSHRQVQETHIHIDNIQPHTR